jgi:hypothetical protein
MHISEITPASPSCKIRLGKNLLIFMQNHQSKTCQQGIVKEGGDAKKITYDYTCITGGCCVFSFSRRYFTHSEGGRLLLPLAK